MDPSERISPFWHKFSRLALLWSNKREYAGTFLSEMLVISMLTPGDKLVLLKRKVNLANNLFTLIVEFRDVFETNTSIAPAKIMLPPLPLVW